MFGKRHVVLLALAMAPLASLTVSAETVTFNAALSSANNPSATGTLEATFDTETMVLSWVITYSGLSGPAVAAHYHGPARAGENAGVLVPLEGDLTAPISGEATLSADIAADLQNGFLYLNIHTAQNPGGELRGQLPAAEYVAPSM